MEEKKIEKKKGLLITIVLIAIVLVIGGTYAWLTFTDLAENTNTIKAGTLTLTLTDDTEGIYISGEAAEPILDADGLQLTGYDFTLENTGDFGLNYTVYLDDVDTYFENTTTDGGTPTTIEKTITAGERMNNNHVKFTLYDKTTEEMPISKLSEKEDRALVSGSLSSGDRITYNLKLWISDDADNTVMGKIFAGKIRVEAIQTKSGTSPVPSSTTGE